MIAMLNATGVPSAKVNGTLEVEGTVDVTLTGTVGATNGSAAITGSGTAFTTELEVGNAIAIASSVAAGYEVFTVSAITNDTSLTIDSNYAGTTATGLDAWCDPNLFEIDNGDNTNLLTVDKSGKLKVKGFVVSDGFKDEDNMSSNSATAAASQQSIKAYVDSKCVFTDRGDPDSYDFRVADFTTNDNWYDLDLSSIVPSGAKAVVFTYWLEDDVVSSRIYFRKNGNSYSRAVGKARVIVADQEHWGTIIVPCDSNRIIEYRATNTTFTRLDIVVTGWF